MKGNPIMFKRASAAAAVVAVTIALSSCSLIQSKVEDGINQAVEEGVERAIENGAGSGTDIEFGADATLPAGWPAEVPVPNAKVTAGVSNADGWWATFETDDQSVVDALFAKYSSWEVTAEQDIDGFIARQYTSDKYYVVVASIASDGLYQLTVQVTPISG